MAATVRSVMQLPILSSTRLAGGSLGLDREIASANITDSPDIANWVRSNQLLLTTAYHFKDNPEGLIPLLYQLNDRQCAGLAIKTKRYVDVLPPGLVEAADSLRFPLIELPNNMLLGDVLNQILEHVLNDRQFELQRTLDVHRRFSDLFLRGASMSDISQTLASLVKRPVLILNAMRMPAGYSDSLRRRIETTDLAGQARGLIRSLPFAEGGWTSVPLNDEETLIVYPVDVAGLRKGYICVLNSAASVEATLNMMPLEQASYIVAYEHMRQEALKEGEKRLRRLFFSDWLDDRLGQAEAKRRCESYGIADGNPHLVAVCCADPSREGKLASSDAERAHQSEQWLERLGKLAEELPVPLLAELKAKYVVLLIRLPDTDATSYDEAEYTSLLKQLQSRLEDFFPEQRFSFGMSNRVSQLDKFPSAYQEARQALESGYSFRKSNFIQTYRTQQVTELLRSIPDKKLADFYYSSLLHFIQPDLPEHQELLKTLDVYLNCECSIAETAKLMFLHRNTVQNRINRCESLLQFSTRDPIDALKMRIALLIYREKLGSA
jgi:Purine catabolism regulatory protein-like family.